MQWLTSFHFIDFLNIIWKCAPICINRLCLLSNSVKATLLLGTTLASKAWAPPEICSSGDKPKHFPHKEKTPPGGRAPHIFFSNGERAPTLAPPWAKVNMKCIIFSEIIHHLMIPKIHSRMHLIELYFLKIFSEEHNFNEDRCYLLAPHFKPPGNKTEQHYTHHTITQAGCITKPPHYLKNIPPCLNMNFSH